MVVSSNGDKNAYYLHVLLIFFVRYRHRKFKQGQTEQIKPGNYIDQLA